MKRVVRSYWHNWRPFTVLRVALRIVKEIRDNHNKNDHERNV